MGGDFHSDRGKLNICFSPNKILLGVKARGAVGLEAKALGCNHAMILTDPGVLRTGAIEQIRKALHAEGVNVTLFDQVEAETPARVIDEGARLARTTKCDLVVGVGGGSTLDTAKGVALLATERGGGPRLQGNRPGAMQGIAGHQDPNDGRERE